MSVELPDPEDQKLVTLARAHRARAGAPEGAAVRDSDGRTYSAASVALPTLRLSAVEVAVAVAAGSGVTGLEAAVVVTDAAALADTDAAVVREFAGAGVPIYRATAAGDVVDQVST